MVNLALKLLEQCIIGFSRIINYVATFLFGLMVLFVAADVVGRYFFSKPIKGDYEFVEVMTGMVISLSLSYTLVVDQHVRIKILTSRCSQKTQLISDILAYCSGFAVFTLASWQTIVYANSLRVSGLFIGVLPIPAYPFIYIAAISFISLSLVFLVKFIHSLTQGIRK